MVVTMLCVDRAATCDLFLAVASVVLTHPGVMEACLRVFAEQTLRLFPANNFVALIAFCPRFTCTTVRHISRLTGGGGFHFSVAPKELREVLDKIDAKMLDRFKVTWEHASAPGVDYFVLSADDVHSYIVERLVPRFRRFANNKDDPFEVTVGHDGSKLGRHVPFFVLLLRVTDKRSGIHDRQTRSTAPVLHGLRGHIQKRVGPAHANRYGHQQHVPRLAGDWCAWS